jgi:diguanylate cyclase (GGDEF)-like protein
MYYAMPVPKTKESCLRCHSTPEKAPKNLVKKYGSKAGFYEKMGRSRAIVSLTIPLEQDVKNMQKLYNSFIISLSIVLIIILLIVYFAIKILDKKDKKLKDRTEHDGLTDIYNRYKFNKDIDIFTNSQRNSDVLHLIMLDIDHFKKINDTYGHAVGDIILKELCTLISNNIRPTDKFYRVGGEEFTIISFSNTDETELGFANKINKIVQEHHFPKVNNITISIGSTKHRVNESSIALYERCDKALYSAKENGRNRVEFY